jgi:hypothetical protein
LPPVRRLRLEQNSFPQFFEGSYWDYLPVSAYSCPLQFRLVFALPSAYPSLPSPAFIIVMVMIEASS